MDLTVLLYPAMRESAEVSGTDLGIDNSWSLFYHDLYTFIDIHLVLTPCLSKQDIHGDNYTNRANP